MFLLIYSSELFIGFKKVPILRSCLELNYFSQLILGKEMLEWGILLERDFLESKLEEKYLVKF
jgi:hypothetical protein